MLEQEVAKAKEEVQAQTTEAAKMAEETIMLRLQDDVQAAAYHELRVERMRQALSKLDAQADMKQAEISAAEELVDENEASVVGNLLPHLKNKALEAELRKVYGDDADKKIQQMAASDHSRSPSLPLRFWLSRGHWWGALTGSPMTGWEVPPSVFPSIR